MPAERAASVAIARPRQQQMLAVNAATAVASQSHTSSSSASSSQQHSRPCRLRIFEYKSFLPHLQLQQASGKFFGYSKSLDDAGQNTSCLEGPCEYGSFGFNNVRQYTSEVPVYRRLISRCPTTTDPEMADVFLVPFFYGYMMTLGWQSKTYEMPAAWKAAHHQMVRAALTTRRLLTHLNNETAARHVILFTCDSQFVNIDLHPQLRTSTIIHLGDDGFHGYPSHSYYVGAMVEKHKMPNTVVVPYRVSQWLPIRFVPPVVGPRRWLLSMNVNLERSHVRKRIAAALLSNHSDLGVPKDLLLVTSKMMGPKEAAEVARSSTFCICPTGDSKGFTARFYFVLLNGCLPVRVDGYGRNTTLAPTTFPFPRLINWSKIIIDMPPHLTTPHHMATMLPQILHMSAREIEERQSYLRHVAHWLLFDQEDDHSHHDAPAALIHELHGRFSHGMVDAAQSISISPDRTNAVDAKRHAAALRLSVAL